MTDDDLELIKELECYISMAREEGDRYSMSVYEREIYRILDNETQGSKES